MTWVAAGIASGEATMAGVQYFKGKQDQKNAAKNRPVSTIPSEITANLNTAQQQALQGLPEAQKQQYLNNLQQTSAYSLAQNKSLKGGLMNVATLNQQQIQGDQNLLSADSVARQNNIQGLMKQRQNLADYKQQNFQQNQLNPYYENLANNQALNGALFQNLNKAVGTGAALGINKMKGISWQSQQNSYSNSYTPNFNSNSYTPNFNSNLGNYGSTNNPQGIVPDGGYDISNIG